MAGMKPAQRMRGRYTSAGYAHTQPSMYIAKSPAGSAQDNLRDFNRMGYRSERPWTETPEPAFEGGSIAVPVRAPARKKKKQTFAQWIIACAKKEKKDFAVCCVLLVCIMMMTAAWGQNLISAKEVQDRIARYHSDTRMIEEQNRILEGKIEDAKSSVNIRTAANAMNMIRPERAVTQTIYISSADQPGTEMPQQTEEPRMEILDILLGLLNVLNIGE